MATYAQSGVDYSTMDPVKVAAQQAARGTASHLQAFDASEVKASRGESAYVWEESDAYRALVIEGLGTKNLIADAMRLVTGKTYYDCIARDTVAMIVNDLVVVGALPQVVNAYFAIGDSDWMRDKLRVNDLIRGWADACQKSGATWGGGETPTLKHIVNPATIDLAGSAAGIIRPKERLILGDKLQTEDAIVLIESSGIHANGITFVRALAERIPDIYETTLPDGRMLGEAILTPTHLYVQLVRTMLEADIDIHYMVNITGHGWRKLMRATREFTYMIDLVAQTPPEFLLIQKLAEADDNEMYSTFNMGAGFAIYVPHSDAQKVVNLAHDCQLSAFIAGKVLAGPKQVVIRPKDIVFGADTLGVR